MDNRSFHTMKFEFSCIILQFIQSQNIEADYDLIWNKTIIMIATENKKPSFNMSMPH